MHRRASSHVSSEPADIPYADSDIQDQILDGIIEEQDEERKDANHRILT